MFYSKVIIKEMDLGSGMNKGRELKTNIMQTIYRYIFGFKILESVMVIVIIIVDIFKLTCMYFVVCILFRKASLKDADID